MDTIDSELLILRRLGSGRIAFACTQVSKLLDAWEASATPPQGDEIKAVAKLRRRIGETERAVDHHISLDRARQTALAPSAQDKTPKLKVVDSASDRLLGNAHRALKSTVEDFPPLHPRREAAATLLDHLFPNGVRPIVNLPGAEQLARMQAILKDCASPNLKPHIHTLDLQDRIQRLEESTQLYSVALHANADKTAAGSIPTSIQVADALRDANARLGRVVTKILGSLDPDDNLDDDTPTPNPTPTQAAPIDRRRALLAPILYQHDAAKRARNTHGTDIDADPITGEDLPPPAPTLPQPPPTPEA